QRAHDALRFPRRQRPLSLRTDACRGRARGPGGRVLLPAQGRPELRRAFRSSRRTHRARQRTARRGARALGRALRAPPGGARAPVALQLVQLLRFLAGKVTLIAGRRAWLLAAVFVHVLALPALPAA